MTQESAYFGYESVSITVGVLTVDVELRMGFDPPTERYTEFPNSHPCNSIARKLNCARCSLTWLIA